MRIAPHECMVNGCQEPNATHLGVCSHHWRELPLALKRGWWFAWRDDARTASWLTCRRILLGYLNGGVRDGELDQVIAAGEQLYAGAVNAA